MSAPNHNNPNRTIFIGDVHGCIKELQLLLKEIKPTSTDRLIFLGDLINRGPDSVAVVDLVAQNDYECLMGNHEAEYLSLYSKKEEYSKLHHKLGGNLHQWITNRDRFIESDNFLAVHAGVEPGVHPSMSRDKILFNIRTWDGKGIDIKKISNPPWYNFYTDNKPVFYGHWAHAGLNLRSHSMGLDSGCVYGKYLSAWIVEQSKLIQIKAQKTWYVPPALRKKKH